MLWSFWAILVVLGTTTAQTPQSVLIINNTVITWATTLYTEAFIIPLDGETVGLRGYDNGTILDLNYTSLVQVVLLTKTSPQTKLIFTYNLPNMELSGTGIRLITGEPSDPYLTVSFIGCTDQPVKMPSWESFNLTFNYAVPAHRPRTSLIIP